jgi:hypothetical protein
VAVRSHAHALMRRPAAHHRDGPNPPRLMKGVAGAV